MLFAITGLFALNLSLLAQALVPLHEGKRDAGVESPACLDDWVDLGSRGCFKFLESAINLTWAEAQRECEEIGGYLAEPRSYWQAELLHSIAKTYESIHAYGIDHWWIGLTDAGQEGNWIWSHSGEALTDSFWGSDFPNTSAENIDDCGVLVGVIGEWPSSWKDTSCAATSVDQKKVAAICQKDGVCPENWTPFNGNCYRNLPQRMTWEEAEKNCNSIGGHLASIHSADENDFIHNLLYWTEDAPWLGASDAVEGRWKWTDGTDMDYTHWMPGKPNRGTSYNCMLLGDSQSWLDMDCTVKQLAVCKMQNWANWF